MKRMSEIDKLECAEYVLDLLESKLAKADSGKLAKAGSGNVYPSERGAWLQRCKDECIMRLGQYMRHDFQAPGGEL